MKGTFYDINKFPSSMGMIIFPISMSRISNSQSGDYYFKVIDRFSVKVQRAVLGANFIYTESLYSRYKQDSTASKNKYFDLMITHKNKFIKTLRKESMYVEPAFSFLTWTQICLNSKDFFQKIAKLKKIYEEDSFFQKCISADLKNFEKEFSPDNVDFLLEEALLTYLILREELEMQNDFLGGREKWRLFCYPGKPNLSLVYILKKDFFKIKSSNIYMNCFYDLEQNILYDFDKITYEDILK